MSQPCWCVVATKRRTTAIERVEYPLGSESDRPLQRPIDRSLASISSQDGRSGESRGAGTGREGPVASLFSRFVDTGSYQLPFGALRRHHPERDAAVSGQRHRPTATLRSFRPRTNRPASRHPQDATEGTGAKPVARRVATAVAIASLSSTFRILQRQLTLQDGELTKRRWTAARPSWHSSPARFGSSRRLEEAVGGCEDRLSVYNFWNEPN